MCRGFMNSTRILNVVFLCYFFIATGPIFAHDARSESGLGIGELGVAHFANSGAVRAQPAFLRGLLLLHSFEYAAARPDFQEAEKTDPGFAMAYWGEALTYNQPLWREQDRDAARAAKTPTLRERGYLASVEQPYGVGDKAARDAAYCAALGVLADQYPTDLDARALYTIVVVGFDQW